MPPSPSIAASIQERFGRAAAAYAVSAVHRGGADLDAMVAAARLSGRERLHAARRRGREELVRIEGAAVAGDDGAAARERVERGELSGAVHQRAGGQQPHGAGLGRDAVALLLHAGRRRLPERRDAAAAFAPHAAEVVALDLTEAMLEQGRRLAAERGIANLRFERGDAARLPFEAASFERVTSRLSAHHYADPAAVLREVARVLTPGGAFLLVDVAAPEDPAQDSFLNAFELLRDPSHVRDHSVRQWCELLRAAGLAPELCGRFEIQQEFDAWVERMGTGPASVVGLRALCDEAPEEVRGAFGIRGHGAYDFRLELALFRATRA